MTAVDFEIWLNHFEHHARHPGRVPPGVSDILKPDERLLIADSIATFQLGEQSEGRTLRRAAERCASARRMPALVRIIDLLIREEQVHAAQLRAFMEEHRIALKKTDWTDRAFRVLRRLAGLELYLHVLISAELIGIAYYRSLAAATDCERLQMLCRVFVCDELAHVGFESQLLLALRAERAVPTQALMRLAHRAFFTCTAATVWFTHRRLLRQAHHDASGFLRACRAHYAFHLDAVQLPLQRGHRNVAAFAAPTRKQVTGRNPQCSAMRHHRRG